MAKKVDSPQRHYPAVYEKLVPLALLLILVAVIALLLVTFGVVFQTF